MEGDEIALEPINIWLPLPYRVLFLILLGIWLFAFNLHYLNLIRIDVAPFLHYTRNPTDPHLHRSIYHVATLISGVFAANLFLFWSITGGSAEAVKQYQLLPMLLFPLLAIAFLLPSNAWHGRGRWRFLRMLRRVIIGGIDPDLSFADTLLADALTSYARVFEDAVVVFSMFFSGASATPDRSAWIAPCMIAVPYLCRLRQCVIEYLRARKKDLPGRCCRNHLWNAGKYASAFPVIFIGALQRNRANVAWSRLWYVAVIGNSLFSFYWDVTMDWGLAMLTTRQLPENVPWGLRKNRHFVNSGFYYVAVGIDLVLRCVWSVKLSPHLGSLHEMESGIFVFELLEIFRRWIWVFFRVEKEFVVAKSLEMGFDLADEDGIMLS